MTVNTCTEGKYLCLPRIRVLTLYMPEGHDHAKWKKEKEEKVKKFKERREKKKREKSSSTAPNPSNKLTLANNLKSALATKLGVSDADAARLIEDATPKE